MGRPVAGSADSQEDENVNRGKVSLYPSRLELVLPSLPAFNAAVRRLIFKLENFFSRCVTAV